jgi:TolB-like protein
MLSINRTFALLLVPAALMVSSLRAAERETKPANVYPVAILPFQERGADVKGDADRVADLLFASLVADPSLCLVDRSEITKLIQEQELNLSGVVSVDQATKAGQVTGAKILVTGSVFQVNNTVYLIAKIIGTETTRVVGASVKGNVRDDLGKLVESLGAEVAKTIGKRADELVAKPASREDRIATLKKRLGDAKRPAVMIELPERHVGLPAIDPAAETELSLFCTELGFKVIDGKEGKATNADLLLRGEAFSESAMRHGNLISVKARLELKAVDPGTGKVVAVDRQTSVAVDLAEQIAAKTALQEAAAAVAERLLPKIVVPGDKRPK